MGPSGSKSYGRRSTRFLTTPAAMHHCASPNEATERSKCMTRASPRTRRAGCFHVSGVRVRVSMVMKTGGNVASRRMGYQSFIVSMVPPEILS